MRFFVDLDSREVRTAAVGFPAESVALPRNGTVDAEVRYVRDGVVVDPGSPAAVYLAVKSYGAFAEDPPLLVSGNLTKSGTTTTTKWAGAFVVAAAGLETAFAAADEGDLPEGEPRTVPALLEIVRVDGATVRPSRAVPAVIENSIYRSEDAAPVSTGAAGFIYRPDITALTGGAATALDGIAVGTAPYVAGAIVKLYRGGNLEDWLLRAIGADVEDGVVLVVPDNDPTLIWQLKLST